MKTAACSLLSTGSHTAYAQMPLLELAERILHHSDTEALKELHDHRAISRSQDRRPLRLVEYVASLSQRELARRWCGYDDMVVAGAYDLTVDKFSNMPAATVNRQRLEPHGPDCRYYLAAFVDHTTAILGARPPANALEAEIVATQMLRRLVTRHFHFSCLESKRRVQRLARRYVWKLNGQTRPRDHRSHHGQAG